MTSPKEPGTQPASAAQGTSPQPLVGLSATEIAPLREAMLDLQMSVADYYAATAHGDNLGPRVRSFLVTAQTLNELLANTITQSALYRDLFGAQRHPAAELIDAIKFARNVVQHVLHIVRPSDDMTLVGGALGTRVYATWDSVPSSAVAHLRPATRKLEPAYRAVLEGHEVTGTMMTALRFYAEVAPAIVHRNSRNEWTGFPLLSQPGVNTPLHPEEPAELAASRQWMDNRVPGGDCRVVCGQVTVSGTHYVYGHTFVGRHSFAPFVETVEQANYDMDLGYKYLEGDIAANFEDVTDQFPDALQGSVILSRGDVLDWASPIAHLGCRDDWQGPGVDANSWRQVVTIEVDPTMPEGFIFGPRRARRLNALVPPR